MARRVVVNAAMDGGGVMPIVVEILRDGRRATLHSDWEFVVGGVRWLVPRGFTTDFASVPRMFWRLVPPWGSYSYAAVLHDWLYARNGVTRARADRILLDAMRELGVGWAVRWVIYGAVRLGGWVAWREHRRRNG